MIQVLYPSPALTVATAVRFHFDTISDRRGAHCEKWDTMEERYGVCPEDGLSIWGLAWSSSLRSSFSQVVGLVLEYFIAFLM